MTGATLGKIAMNFNKNQLYLVNQRVGIFNLGENPIERAPYLYMLLQQDFVLSEFTSVGGDSAQAIVSENQKLLEMQLLIL